jgi:hypothetical protein
MIIDVLAFMGLVMLGLLNPAVPLYVMLRTMPNVAGSAISDPERANGDEDRVMGGATRLLSAVRRRILREVTPKNAEIVTRALHSAAYALYDADLPYPGRDPLTRAAWTTPAIRA